MSAAATMVGGAALAGSPVESQAATAQVPSQDENSTMADEFLVSGPKVNLLIATVPFFLCHGGRGAGHLTCNFPLALATLRAFIPTCFIGSLSQAFFCRPKTITFPPAFPLHPPTDLWPNLDAFRSPPPASRSRKRSTPWRPPSCPARPITR